MEYHEEPRITMINGFGRLNTKINLEDLYIHFYLDELFIGKKFKGNERGFIPPVKKNKKNPTRKVMQNQVTIIYKIHDTRFIKVKIFNTGLIHMPGMKTIKECEELIYCINSKFKEQNEKIFEDYSELNAEFLPNTIMVNMQYTLKITENLNKEELQAFIRTNYKDQIVNAFLNSIYPALKIQFISGDDKIVYIMIQSSGIVAMKGAKGIDAIEQNHKAIDFMNEVFQSYFKSKNL